METVQWHDKTEWPHFVVWLVSNALIFTLAGGYIGLKYAHRYWKTSLFIVLALWVCAFIWFDWILVIFKIIAG